MKNKLTTCDFCDKYPDAFQGTHNAFCSSHINKKSQAAANSGGPAITKRNRASKIAASFDIHARISFKSAANIDGFDSHGAM